MYNSEQKHNLNEFPQISENDKKANRKSEIDYRKYYNSVAVNNPFNRENNSTNKSTSDAPFSENYYNRANPSLDYANDHRNYNLSAGADKHHYTNSLYNNKPYLAPLDTGMIHQNEYSPQKKHSQSSNFPILKSEILQNNRFNENNAIMSAGPQTSFLSNQRSDRVNLQNKLLYNDSKTKLTGSNNLFRTNSVEEVINNYRGLYNEQPVSRTLYGDARSSYTSVNEHATNRYKTSSEVPDTRKDSMSADMNHAERMRDTFNRLENSSQDFNNSQNLSYVSPINRRHTQSQRSHFSNTSTREIELERINIKQRSGPKSTKSKVTELYSPSIRNKSRDDLTQLRLINKISPLNKNVLLNKQSSKISSEGSEVKKRSKRHTLQPKYELSRKYPQKDGIQDPSRDLFTPSTRNKSENVSLHGDTHSSGYIRSPLYPNDDRYSLKSDGKRLYRIDGDSVFDRNQLLLHHNSPSVLANTRLGSISGLNMDSHSVNEIEGNVGDNSDSMPEPELKIEHTDIKALSTKVQTLEKDNFDLKIRNQTLMDSLNQLSNEGLDSLVNDFARAKASNIRANEKIYLLNERIGKYKTHKRLVGDSTNSSPISQLDYEMDRKEKWILESLKNRAYNLEQDLAAKQSELDNSVEHSSTIQNKYTILQKKYNALQYRLYEQARNRKLSNEFVSSQNTLGNGQLEQGEDFDSEFSGSEIGRETNSNNINDHSKHTDRIKSDINTRKIRVRAGTVDTSDTLDNNEGSDAGQAPQSNNTVDDAANKNVAQELLMAISNLKISRDNYKKELNQMHIRYETELGKYDEKVAEYQKANENLENRCNSLQKMNSKLHEQILELEQMLEEAMSSISNNENGDSETRIKFLEEKINKYEEDLKSKETKLKILNRTVAEYKARYDLGTYKETVASSKESVGSEKDKSKNQEFIEETKPKRNSGLLNKLWIENLLGNMGRSKSYQKENSNQNNTTSSKFKSPLWSPAKEENIFKITNKEQKPESNIKVDGYEGSGESISLLNKNISRLNTKHQTPTNSSLNDVNSSFSSLNVNMNSKADDKPLEESQNLSISNDLACKPYI
ncbi:hypothetical protein BB559_002594 [Furculomyces boomerangus]|uniref:Uncharacterized protein n=1 Tax=Furculomyces boomerangus TaxID=61424 RepID=A0A2T9YU32_9FUNG|nr:hypothetical protein BB559_002594 [Furculomyces boomerangus]